MSNNKWLADDATDAGSLKSLKNWWANIISEGGRFGYYINEKKLWLIIKSEALLETAANLFSDSEVNITIEGKRHLQPRTKYLRKTLVFM